MQDPPIIALARASLAQLSPRTRCRFAVLTQREALGWSMVREQLAVGQKRVEEAHASMDAHALHDALLEYDQRKARYEALKRIIVKSDEFQAFLAFHDGNVEAALNSL
jgi:hypothetical protein